MKQFKNKTTCSSGKLFSAAFVVSLFFCHALVHAQSNKRDQIQSVSVKQALESLEKNYNVQCTYDPSLVALNKKIDINNKSKTLQQVLQELSEQTGLQFMQAGSLIGVKSGIESEKHTSLTQKNGTVAIVVHGKVTDENNQPVTGASVVVKGNASGVITNNKGEFSIEINAGQTLVVSHLGFATREFTVSGNNFLTVVLKAVEGKLQEVVVTALGIVKEKKALGYAVQEVKGESLEKVPTPTVVTALTGKVAGLTVYNTTDFFQDPSISLRGRTPLIVIDGVPNRDGDFWKINADDIDNVTVLKGSTASALYGSIGRNGAIMVTTKRGKKKSALLVGVNSSTMFQTGFIRIPKVQTTYGDGNNGQYAYVDGSGSGTEGGGWIWGPKLNQKDPSTPSGWWETPQFNSPIDSTTGKRIPTPWLSRGQNNIRNFFRTGMISSNNVNLSWGNDNGSFRASLGNIYQKGIVPNTDLNNTSFSLSGNYNVAKSLNIDTRVTYNREYTDNFPTVGYGPTNYLYNLVLWIGPDIDIRDLKNYWVKGKEGLQQYNYNTSWYNNPYFIANQYLRGYRKDNTFGSLAVTYDILPSLSAKVRTGINVYGLDRSTKEPYSYVGYSDISRGNYDLTKTNYFDITTDVLLQYKHGFGKNFSVSAEGGGSMFTNNYNSLYTSTDGLTIPGFYNVSNSTNPLQSTSTIQQQKTNSVYASADLEFFKFWYVTLTGRNDWVSTLPVNNNSFFYPSVSSSIVVSDALQMPSYISFLKVRGSWSRVSDGTIGSDPYGAIQTYSIGDKWNNIPSLIWPGTLLSSNLHPETSDSWETGMTVNFFRNRLGIDFTYYQSKDYNNITNIPVSQSSGYDNQLVNGNVYQRKGVELVLSGMPVKTKNLRWNIGVNLSQNHTFLKQIYGGADNLNYVKVGQRMDQLYDWKYETDGKGDIVYGSNGLPVWDNFKRFMGYSNPDWVYGVQNTISYKNLALNFSFDGRIGGTMYSTTNQKMWWGGTNPGTVNKYRDDANAGQATYVGPGVVVTGGDVQYDDEGNITSDSRKYAPNTTPVSYIGFMQSTSNNPYTNYSYYSQTFLKLREVSLTYQLPESLIKNTFIKGATVSVIGNNLLLFAKIPNVDPDSGVDEQQTPSTRQVGFNINLKF